MFHHGHVTDQIKMGFHRNYSGGKIPVANLPAEFCFRRKFSVGNLKKGFPAAFSAGKIKKVSGNFPPETETEFPLETLTQSFPIPLLGWHPV